MIDLIGLACLVQVVVTSHINNFNNLYAIFFIDRRRKLYSIKSERFEGILEALMKNLHLFIPQFFGLDETSALPIV